MTVRHIRNIESGSVARPRKQTLTALAEALRLTDSERAEFVAHYRSTRVEAAGASTQPAGWKAVQPRQLPPRPSLIAGRDRELKHLKSALAVEKDRPGPVLVTGLGGIGKTALAVEACTLDVERYPDGQLYACLADPDGRPRDPTVVLAEFLRVLGVDADAIPRSLEERSALWRSAAAARRILVLLDDAMTEEQVRPLLIGGKGRVVITSRSGLGGLDVAVRIRLAPLDDVAARAVLVAAAGVSTGPADTASITQLVRSCAGVPLALRLVAARLSMRPHDSLTVMASRLGGNTDRIDGLVSGDRSVRRSIEGSLGFLTDGAQHTIAQLARLGTPSFTDWQIAALADSALPYASGVIEEFLAGGLVEPASFEHQGPRYRLHDLVRECLCAPHFGDLTRDAFNRLALYAIHLTAAATPSSVARPVPHVLWPVRPPSLTNEIVATIVGDGRTWFAEEWQNIVALTMHAAQWSSPRVAGGLLAALRQPLTRSGRLDTLVELAERCADASQGDRLAHACALVTAASVYSERGDNVRAGKLLGTALPALGDADPCTLGGAWYEVAWIHHQLGDIPRADDAYQRAIELHRSIANINGELGCAIGLADMHSTRKGGAQDARKYARTARALARSVDDYRTEVKVLLTLGRIGERIGDGSRLRSLADAALNIAQANADKPLIASCLTAVSAAERHRGCAEAAVTTARKAVNLGRELSRPADVAAALTELGHAQRAAGSTRAAATSWRSALAIRNKLGQDRECVDLRVLITSNDSVTVYMP